MRADVPRPLALAPLETRGRSYGSRAIGRLAKRPLEKHDVAPADPRIAQALDARLKALGYLR